MFLALALGILIGVSFGDSVLVANQRDVIQLMEGQLEQLRESGRRRESELQRWETLKPLILASFEGALAGKRIFIVASPDPGEAGLEPLLAGAGAAVSVMRLPAAPAGGAGPLDAATLAGLLAGAGEIGGEELARGGLALAGGDSAVLERPPDCCLLLLEAESYRSDDLFAGLRRGLEESGLRVILLFPWREGGSPRLPAGEGADLSLVDNIDTFWGQAALLRMIAGGIGGHYGFGEGSAGLIPVPAGPG